MIVEQIIKILEEFATPYEDVDNALLFNSKFREIAEKIVELWQCE